MSKSKFYKLLQFNNIKKPEENEEQLGVDAVHFSDKYPTVFFKEVRQFDKETLEVIADIHHNLWNYKKVMFLYVVSLTELRIYNCNSKPEKLEDIEPALEKHQIATGDLKDKENLNKLLEIFSSYAIDSGLLWTRSNEYKKQIKLSSRIDNFLVASLISLAKKLEQDKIDLEVIHSLIMRSLFIMYLEDRGATPKEFYKDKNKESNSYFDLLKHKDSTYTFFQRIQDNFNGNVFPVTDKEYKQIDISHLKLLRQCFINGDMENKSLFKDWRIFKFDIIDIELLSQIYENFLNEIDKKDSGSYYTPPELVELMLNEVLPDNSKDYNIKILDPTCGSGIFLVEAYRRIVTRWQHANPGKEIDFKILKKLMKDSIYGVELNKNSIKVATFSLYLAMLNFLHPKTLWYQGKGKFPYLINDKEDVGLTEQGHNLFRTDMIADNKEIEKNYDVIVGNPPYGKKGIPSHIKQYCNKYEFSKEFVIPFMHKSTLLAPNGKIALLAPTKILTNTSQTSQNFREWLFNDHYIEKIYNLSILRKAPQDFGGRLFSSAVVPASIFFFQVQNPKSISKTIEYWAPKTYIKNHLAEGVIIDSSDIKYLPRHECQKPDTKIWKIAQWGKLNDFNLLNKLVGEKTFFDYLNDNGINKDNMGVGFQIIGASKTKFYENNKIHMFGYMDARKLSRYYTPESLKEEVQKSVRSREAIGFYTKHYNATSDNLPTINIFRREGKINTFKANHILIKEGFSNNLFCAAYLDYECSFTSTVLGLKSDNSDLLKLITCYLNSKFSTYFLFLTSSSWGIERDRVKPNELYLLPTISKKINMNKISKIYDGIRQKIEDEYPLTADISEYEKQIDKIISDSLGILENEQILIDDTIKYSLNLFNEGQKSIAIEPLDTNNPESIEYGNKLCYELNEVLEDSGLNVASTIYRVSYYSPLCLVVLQFGGNSDILSDEASVINADSEFNRVLAKLNEHTIQEYLKSIYIQKNLTYFDNDRIYIIKPNQKRFWSQSSAIEDAHNIKLEIMSML